MNDIFSFAGYIVNKTHSSLEPNTVTCAHVQAQLVGRRHLSEKMFVLFPVFN